MEEVARWVSVEFDVPSAELYRRRAGWRVARSVFIELCRLYLTRRMSHAEIGRRLGFIDDLNFLHNILFLA